MGETNLELVPETVTVGDETPEVKTEELPTHMSREDVLELENFSLRAQMSGQQAGRDQEALESAWESKRQKYKFPKGAAIGKNYEIIRNPKSS